jgi:hypothetical protein
MREVEKPTLMKTEQAIDCLYPDVDDDDMNDGHVRIWKKTVFIYSKASSLSTLTEILRTAMKTSARIATSCPRFKPGYLPNTYLSLCKFSIMSDHRLYGQGSIPNRDRVFSFDPPLPAGLCGPRRALLSVSRGSIPRG